MQGKHFMKTAARCYMLNPQATMTVQTHIFPWKSHIFPDKGTHIFSLMKAELPKHRSHVAIAMVISSHLKIACIFRGWQAWEWESPICCLESFSDWFLGFSSKIQYSERLTNRTKAHFVEIVDKCEYQNPSLTRKLCREREIVGT